MHPYNNQPAAVILTTFLQNLQERNRNEASPYTAKYTNFLFFGLLNVESTFSFAFSSIQRIKLSNLLLIFNAYPSKGDGANEMKIININIITYNNNMQ